MWIEVWDGHRLARLLFKRHYSYRPHVDGRRRKLFVGPGWKMVLITAEADALFVWRKFKSADGQQGVNCAVFRNESERKSSDMILEAEKLAHKRWPQERFYTYVNAKKIKSTNPGFCFLQAGWRKIGITKVNKLLILEKLGASAHPTNNR